METFFYCITLGADAGEQGELTVFISEDSKQDDDGSYNGKLVSIGHQLLLAPSEEDTPMEVWAGAGDWNKLKATLMLIARERLGMRESIADYWIIQLLDFLSGRKEFPIVDEAEFEELASLTPADFLR